MANNIEKIFTLLLKFGDSEKKTEEMTKRVQSLNAHLNSTLKTIQEIGKTDGFKKASEALGVYKLTVDSSARAKKKLVEVDKEENAQTEAAAKYIDQLKAKYGNLIFTKKEMSTLTKNYTTLQRAEKGSMEETTAKINILRTAWSKMGAEALKNAPGKQVTADLKQLRDQANKTKTSVGDFSGNIGRHAAGIKSAFAKISGAWVTIKGIYNLFRGGIKTIADFEQANANLATVLGKSASEIKDLTESALELGRTTEYTASQVTQLQTELAKLGFSEAAIQAMQKPVLQFATAVGANLADAAALAGATLRTFDLDANDTEEMLSVLAVATNKSALSFSYLQTSMAIVSPVARMFGFDVKDTAALLGTLANSGFDASMAATATRNILLHLADANGKLAQALGQPVRTLPELVAGLQSLRDRGIDLATTLELTDKRSVAAFNTFLNGAEGLQTLRGELENTSGELKRIQEERLNTVEGSVKLLTSAWEGLVLSFSNSKGVFKTVIDLITQAINGVNILLNPNSQIAIQKSQFAEQLMGAYQKGGAVAYKNEVSVGSEYWSQKYIAAKDRYQNSGGLLGAGDYKVAKTMWEAFRQAVVETNTGIAKGIAEDAARKEKASEGEMARIAAEKSAKAKAAQDVSKVSQKAAEDKARAEETYTANRKAQEDTLSQYDVEHREAEVQKMDECVDKKIKLNDLAVEKSLTSAQREYDGKIAALDKEIEANKGNQAKINEINAEKALLFFAHDQKCTDIRDAGANARVKILSDATEEELTEYGKLKGKTAEVEYWITENKRLEVEKRLKLAQMETEQSVERAGNQFQTNEALADVTVGKSGRKRNVARLQNEVQLHKDQAQAYQTELNAILSGGDEAIEKHKTRFNELIRLIGQEQNAAMNLGKGKTAGGERKSIWTQFTEMSDEDINQIKQQAFNLASQISDALFASQQQASQRRLDKEKKTIDAQYKTEAKLLDSKRDKGLISEKTYQKELEKLEADKAKKEEVAEREAFERKKKLDIKQALINTALAVGSALATSVPFLPMGPIMAAFAFAQGMVQVATIASQKYEQGGIIPLGDGMGVVKGRSHAQGGHQIYIDGRPIGEIEGDELIAIVNKHDTRRIGALSAANSVHGRKFASGGLMFPNGVMTSKVMPPVSIASLDAQLRVQEMQRQEAILSKQNDAIQVLAGNIEAINNRIDTLKVVVVESDITEAQNNIKKIKVRSTW